MASAKLSAKKSSRSKKRISVAVVFGGMSGEHEVSLQSAASIIAALDKKKYEVLPVRVEKTGRWTVDPAMLSASGGNKSLNGKSSDRETRLLAPGTARGALLASDAATAERVDVVFPIVHGSGGEDGALQGLMELSGLPYVGSGILGSAIGMDKVTQKKLLERDGFPVAPYVHFRASDWKKNAATIVSDIEKTLNYPCFVKPANLGSSVGVSKAHHRKELRAGIEDALTYDTKIVVEKAVLQCREIECGVLGNDKPRASVLGEIVPSNEFYDYAAKYLDGKSKVIIPADLPKQITEKIRAMALKAFRTLDTAGFARVDFFVERTTNEVYINEVNTLPGFTSISMFPMLWSASGISYPDLLDELITLALQKDRERRKLKRSFTPPAPKKA
jgi:D-alanine-D-alanine ligase